MRQFGENMPQMNSCSGLNPHSQQSKHHLTLKFFILCYSCHKSDTHLLPLFFLSWQKKNRMKTETAVISSNVYFFYSKKQGNLSLKSPGLCILKKIIKLLVIWKNNPILENLWDPAFEVFSNEAWCLVWEKGWIYELHLKCSVALRKWDRPQTAISVLVVHVNLRK